MKQELNTIKDVSLKLGVAVHVIQYAHASGKLAEPPLRLAGKRIYSKSDYDRVAEYFKQRKKKAGHDE